jgi:ATP-dependent DNA helicase RecG
MQNMTSDIQYIKGIGPQRAVAFAQIGIHSISDLISYFPRKYLDRSTIVPLDQLKTDIEITVIGKIEAVGIRPARKRIFYIVISDGKGILEAVWFSYVDQYKRIFKVGNWVSLSGKVSFYRGYQMAHPDFDQLGDGDLGKMLHTGKILPVYPSSDKLKRAGINSYTFRTIFHNLLDKYLDRIEEIFPAQIISQHNFLGRKECFRNVHFPETPVLLRKSLHRLKYEEFFFFQLMLALQRRHVRHDEPGIAFERSSTHLEQLFYRLPFEMTAAQKRVVKEIRSDMRRPHPMNRLLQGDVGSGKTLVALMAMLIAVDNGYQTALMVPTEILAEQHYINIQHALKDMDIAVSLLTGSTPKRQRQLLMDMLNNREPHIVIGTHALIQENVDFTRLGLVVIDEQHRFGVMQRASLLEKGIRCDVLVMTATPIPRTLALTLYGNLDVSLLDELPPHRKKIQTVWRFDDKADEIYGFVKRRLQENEQAFVVFPLVAESEKIDLKAASESYHQLKRTEFKDWPIALLHGRLKSQEKENIMSDFVSGKIKVLVTTTVIEVGVDIPNATVMLIEHAERFGLSQLHQLRGRIGRSSSQSYCILKTPYNIGDVATQRMKIMTETTDGFKIAEEDLRMRGWGEFFGIRQHGLPSFKLAHPILDQNILNHARTDAFGMVRDDPQIRRSENKLVKDFFVANYAEKLGMIKIG